MGSSTQRIVVRVANWDKATTPIPAVDRSAGTFWKLSFDEYSKAGCLVFKGAPNLAEISPGAYRDQIEFWWPGRSHAKSILTISLTVILRPVSLPSVEPAGYLDDEVPNDVLDTSSMPVEPPVVGKPQRSALGWFMRAVLGILVQVIVLPRIQNPSGILESLFSLVFSLTCWLVLEPLILYWLYRTIEALWNRRKG